MKPNTTRANTKNKTV